VAANNVNKQWSVCNLIQVKTWHPGLVIGPSTPEYTATITLHLNVIYGLHKVVSGGCLRKENISETFPHLIEDSAYRVVAQTTLVPFLPLHTRPRSYCGIGINKYAPVGSASSTIYHTNGHWPKP
jgi:hypothetical protein